MNTSTKTNLILDITIFVAFLVIASPALTGNTIHEWLSVAFSAAIITHLLFHWKWLVSMTRNFFKNLFHQSRLNYVINLLFFITMTAVTLSGLLISKDVMSFLGIQLDAGSNWKMIHKLASDWSLILLGIHFALHWKWVVTNIAHYIVSPIRTLFQPRMEPQSLSIQPVHVEKEK